MKMSLCPCPPLSVTLFLTHLIKVLFGLFVIFFKHNSHSAVFFNPINLSFCSQALLLSGSHADCAGRRLSRLCPDPGGHEMWI